MNDNVHPIFQDILNGFFPEQSKKTRKAKMPSCVETAKELIECAVEDTDIEYMFTVVEELAAMRVAVAEHPDELIKVIKDFESKAIEKLIDHDICPDCGTRLEWEADSRYDTYVPYGSTFVKESDGGSMKCPSCGYTKE